MSERYWDLHEQWANHWDLKHMSRLQTASFPSLSSSQLHGWFQFQRMQALLLKKHFHYENNNIYKADKAILEDKQNGEQMQHTQLKKADKRSPCHTALRDPLTDLPYQNRHDGYEMERSCSALQVNEVPLTVRKACSSQCWWGLPEAASKDWDVQRSQDTSSPAR